MPDPIIGDKYRYLEDKERFRDGDLAFGRLEDGTTGWGRIPAWLVGQYFCEGAAGHPVLAARRKEQ